jgi:hypothetical protein
VESFLRIRLVAENALLIALDAHLVGQNAALVGRSLAGYRSPVSPSSTSWSLHSTPDEQFAPTKPASTNGSDQDEQDRPRTQIVVASVDTCVGRSSGSATVTHAEQFFVVHEARQIAAQDWR